MAQVFIPFPFSKTACLQDLGIAPVSAVPASLAGYRVACASGGWLPCPVADTGGTLAGVCVSAEHGAAVDGLATRLGWALRQQGDLLALLPACAAPDAPEAAPEAAPGAEMAAWPEALFDEVWRELMARPAVDLRPRMPQILARASARVAARTTPPTTLRSTLEAHQAVEFECALSHDGFFLTRRYDLQVPLLDGGLSPVVRREVFVATDAAIVLPYDPLRDRVLLVEQFRMGPYGRGDPLPFCLEPVAGRVDAVESPEETARRECVEEAGLVLRRLEHVSSHYASPGASTEFFHCYVGICDLPEMTQGRGGLADEHEDIRTHVVPFEQALQLVRTGEANVGPLVTCLFWLQAERARLRAVKPGEDGRGTP